MEEENKGNWHFDKPKNYEFFSKVVRAGQRTYFFDARASQDNDFYITISESKRVPREDGSTFYEKHKIFIYPEDFDQFSKGLSQITDCVRNVQNKTIKHLRTNRTKDEKIEARDTYHEFEKQEPVTENYTNVGAKFKDL